MMGREGGDVKQSDVNNPLRNVTPFPSLSLLSPRTCHQRSCAPVNTTKATASIAIRCMYGTVR